MQEVYTVMYKQRLWQIAKHTYVPYLAARALWGHVSDGFFVLLQDFRQGNITSFIGHIKY